MVFGANSHSIGSSELGPQWGAYFLFTRLSITGMPTILRREVVYWLGVRDSGNGFEA